MLNTAVRNTKKLIRQKSKEEGIRIGNRFTKKETAACLASRVLPTPAVLTLVDAGAGTGILTAAVAEELCSRGGVREIYATLYETNPEYLPLLLINMKRVRQKCKKEHGVKFRYEIRDTSFLAAFGGATAEKARYDLVLLSPEDTLPEKEDEDLLRESELFRIPVSRAYLFLAAALRALTPNGQVAAILPTELATAPSLEGCRKFLFASTALRHIQLFSVPKKKRETNGDRNDVLRKNMILVLENGAISDDIRVSASYDEGASSHTLPVCPSDFLIRGEGHRILLLQSEEELLFMKTMEALPETLSSHGLRMKTGLVIPSRYPELLSAKEETGSLPLFSPAGIQNGHVVFPLPEKNQYVFPRIPSLKQPNKNMLLLRRAPSKADGRHLYAAVYLASQFPRHTHISTHNKLMYIDCIGNGEIDPPFLYGLYTLFNSTMYERYCTVLSKSKQVNAADYKDLPLPAADVIRKLGRMVMTTRQYTTKACDILVKNALLPKTSVE